MSWLKPRSLKPVQKVRGSRSPLACNLLHERNMLVFNTLKLFPPQVPHTPQHPRQVESLEAAAVILEQEFEKCELIKVETCGAANPKIDDRQGSEYLDLCFFIFQHDEETIIPRNGLDFLICGSISLRLMFSNTIDSDTLCLHLLVFISMLTHVSLIYIFDRLRVSQENWWANL